MAINANFKFFSNKNLNIFARPPDPPHFYGKNPAFGATYSTKTNFCITIEHLVHL